MIKIFIRETGGQVEQLVNNFIEDNAITNYTIHCAMRDEGVMIVIDYADPCEES